MQLIKDMDGTVASFQREELRELRRRLIVSGLDNAHEWIQMLNSAVEEIPEKPATKRIMSVQVIPGYLDEDADDYEEGEVR